PSAIQRLIWRWFFDRLAHRNDSIAIEQRLYIPKLQTSMSLARDRQDFVRPNLGVTVDRDIRWQLPIARFMRRHVINHLMFKAMDLPLELLFWQPGGHLREQRFYRIVIPKLVELLLANASASWRLIAQFQRKSVSAFISQR